MRQRISLRVREVAESKGITNGTQLKAACGFSSLTTASKLWNNKTNRLDLITLQLLCDGLECELSELFDFPPAPKKKRA